MHGSTKPLRPVRGEPQVPHQPSGRLPEPPSLAPFLPSRQTPTTRPSTDGRWRSCSLPVFSGEGPASANGVSSTGGAFSEVSSARGGVGRGATSSAVRSSMSAPRSWSGLDRHGGHVAGDHSDSVADDAAGHPEVQVVGAGGAQRLERQAAEPLPVRSRPLVGLPASRILAYYRSKGDMQRTKPYVDSIAARKPSKFNTQTLRKFRLFALSTGRCGLSNKGRAEYWESVVAAEVAATAGTGRLGPMQSAFDTAAKFVSSLRHEQDRFLHELGWRQTEIVIGEQTFTFYSRDLWDVAIDAILSAEELTLFGVRRVRGDGSIIRTGTMDSDLFLQEQDSVFAIHKLAPSDHVFVLATQLYSDAALISWSGGTSAGGVRAAGGAAHAQPRCVFD